MRILILTNKMPYPPRDGGSIASLSLALSLNQCQNQVEILSMNTSKHYTDLDSIPKDITDKIKIHAVKINTDTSVFKAFTNLIFSSQPYNAQRFISKEFKNKLIDILQKNDYNIVQLEGLYLCPYIETIKKYSKAKISFRAHNIEHEIWERASLNETSSFYRIYKKNLAKRIKNFKLSYLNKYDLLVPITERDGKIFNEFGNSKPQQVTPTGIDKNNRFLNVENKGKFPGFFHIGALDWIPNQEGLTWFIENIWNTFIKENPDCILTIAGRNAPVLYEEYLRNCKNIDYLGEIEDAVEFIASQSIMIVPLLSGSGMRIKIIEGMAAGKTIISTSIGTEGINTSHEKNVLIANSSAGFLTYLNKIKNNKDFHNSISVEARKFILENFDNLKIAENLNKFYLSHIK
ncbi:MAG: glycosyltransferase family 4 protein [Bacteroidales bacterium]|jgi:glycosyltransferase involved in cell wall biosynthesis|nr:glycosyltransferase family 4 protein [Bacteroidales bacterium]MCK9499683.1 glycosyltransferase family 4 protein [Bacteroidales bacterium]MDY0315920.1 glycosyltransferase family 4 protein [Bacteroidales bacterium]NLB85657.1 glycosyltransferase family 4 protein [Bacteroidales bacterium]